MKKKGRKEEKRKEKNFQDFVYREAVSQNRVTTIPASEEWRARLHVVVCVHDVVRALTVFGTKMCAAQEISITTMNRNKLILNIIIIRAKHTKV